MSAAGPDGPAFAPRPVDVVAIERELDEFFRSEAEPGEAPITRACMSNLLVYCETDAEAADVSAEMPELAFRHPARVLMLVSDPGRRDADIEAFVSAQCNLVGEGRQICSEHVAVHARPDAAARLPSVARPLLIGDLPTALWWAAASPPPLGGPLFQELQAMADQVVYDSGAGWPDPVRGVVATVDWAAQSRRKGSVADLQWRRLRHWRRLLAQALDPALTGRALDTVREVVLEHGPHGLPQAWLLAGWMARQLGWELEAARLAPGVEVTWGFRSAGGPVRVTVRRLAEGAAEVRSVRVGWAGGAERGSVTLARHGRDQVAVGADGAGEPRLLSAPGASRAELLAQQLPDLGRDPVFLDTLAFARNMAASLAG